MPGPDRLLVDTHALLWWQAGSDRLSVRAGRLLAGARQVLVSPVSCWEVGMLVAKGRVALDRPTAAWVRDLLAGDGVAVADLTPSVAVTAAELPDFHGDPADRFLYATAWSTAAPLLSADSDLAGYADRHPGVRVLW